MAGNGFSRIPGDIGLCIVFFTRLPMPPLHQRDRTLAETIWAVPLVGLVVALIGAAVYAAAAFGGLSTGASAALAIGATMLTTGCLHEDGLSDVADGFGGGTTRERKLEIMRDSRIGAFGACALGLSILIRWSAIADLATPTHVLAGLVAAHCASRALMPALMHMLPSARPSGLSANAGTVGRSAALAAGALGLLALLALGLPALMASVVLLVLALIWWRAVCLRQIGGQTGDTIGALQQIGEAIVLLTASAFLF
jgi:adenosylcobinamide-GDP ribazoletransferase